MWVYSLFFIVWVYSSAATATADLWVCETRLRAMHVHGPPPGEDAVSLAKGGMHTYFAMGGSFVHMRKPRIRGDAVTRRAMQAAVVPSALWLCRVVRLPRQERQLRQEEELCVDATSSDPLASATGGRMGAATAAPPHG